MNGIYLSKAQRDFLDQQNVVARREQRIFNQQATPMAAANLASYSTLYPNNSNELGLALVASGVPAADPLVAGVAGIEQSQRAVNGPIDTPGGGIWDGLGRGLSEFIYDPIKGATRWGMMGLMSVYESTVGGAGIRAIGQASQTGRGVFGEDSTLYEQQPFVTKGLADVFRDPAATLRSAWEESTTRDAEQEAQLTSGDMQFTSNFGAGWFPNSTVAPEVKAGVDQATANLHRQLDNEDLTSNQRYRRELEASPDIWSEAIAGNAYQAGLGAPVTQQGYANREAVGFEMPQLFGKTNKVWTPYSPGRIAAATVFEPGTRNFAYASGVGDISSQIFLDPMNLIGAYWAKAGLKGRSLVAFANETLNNAKRGASFGDEFAMLGRNAIEARTMRPVEEFARTGERYGEPTGRRAKGVLAHGGTAGGAEGLQSGGLTHDIDRAIGYAETRVPDRKGVVHLFEEETLPPRLKEAAGKGDVEQLLINEIPEEYSAEFFDVYDELKAPFAKWDDASVENGAIAQRYASGEISYAEMESLREAQFRKIDEAREAYDKTKARLQEGWDPEKKSTFERFAYSDPKQVISDVAPVPYASIPYAEARKLAKAGHLPYVPDETASMASDLKLTVGSVHDMARWSDEGHIPRPVDPPDWAIDEYKNSQSMGGKTRKEFENDYRDFHVPEGTFDEYSTADSTNRSLRSADRRKVSTRSDGSNKMVRVYGRELDLTGRSLKSFPPEVREIIRQSGGWDPVTKTFQGNFDTLAGNISEGTLKQLGDLGYGRIRTSKGDIGTADEWFVLDDFIGGSKNDPLASRTFFEDGNKAIFPSDMPSASNVTPNQINARIDAIEAIARHAINTDGTIDGTKLTPQKIQQLLDDNKDLVKELEGIAASARTPKQIITGARPGLNPSKPYILDGKHANSMVNDLWKMMNEVPSNEASSNLDRFLAKLEKKGTPVPRMVRSALLEAKTAEEIRTIMAAWIGQGPGKLVLPGGTGYGRMRGVMGLIDDIADTTLAGASMRGKGPIGRMVEGSWAKRQFAMMLPSKGINMVDDPDGAYSLMNQMLGAFGLGRGADDVESVFRRLRHMEPGDKIEAYNIMSDYEIVLFEHLRHKIDPDHLSSDFIKEVTSFISENGAMHISNTARVGRTALGGNFGEPVRIGGQAIHAPNMNFTSELWDGAMHIPNPTMVKRVSAYQNRIGRVANYITSKKVYIDETNEFEKATKIAKRVRVEAADIAEKELVEAERGLVKAETKLAKAKSDAAVAKAEKNLKKAKVRESKASFAAEEAIKKTTRRQRLADKKRNSAEILDDIEKNPNRVEIRDRAGYLFARSAMNKLWKPLVLLRGAWLIRIMMDDQMRVAADGMSMFNHPMRTITYALSQPKAWKDSFGKGFVDIHGMKITLDNIDEVQHGLLYQKAMMAMPDGSIGKGAYGAKMSRTIPKGQIGYDEGLVARLSQYGADPVGRKIALSEDSESAIDEVVAWLAGENPSTRSLNVTSDKALRDLIALKANEPEMMRALQNKDPEALKKLVTEMHAEIHHSTGGLVVLDDGKGGLRAYDESWGPDLTDELGVPRPAVRDGPNDVDEMLPVIIEAGDPELLAILANGKGGMSNSLVGSNYTLQGAGTKEFRKLVNKKLRNSDAGRYPATSYGPDFDQFGGKKNMTEMLDTGVSKFYEYLMTRPSNKFSRSPLFAARYWRSMGERLPFVDEATEAIILRKARAAGKEKQVKWAARETRKMLGKNVDRARGTLTKKPGFSQSDLFDTIDEYAKAAGLAEVEETLFNLVQKRNISDSLNLIFPFVEAWGEFATRWSRLMVYGDRNIKNANRLQQGVNGLRESDPFNPTGDQGFFHENEFGQEVFSYPAIATKAQIGLHNVMASIPGLGIDNISPEVADQIKATGTVDSLNFASGIIPGFGPVFQLGAKSVLSEDPRWDSLKRVIAPFGTEGGVATQFAPAWLKRVMSASGSDDPQLKALYLSTVQDVIRTKIADGDFDNAHDKQAIDSVVAEAEDEARNLLFVRAAATWWMPSSPQYKFTETDDTGKVYTYTQLGGEYRKILWDEAGGDETSAFAIFQERFGMLPSGFTGSKSYVVKPGPVTNEGYAFERANPEYFADYPNTAMFLMPDVHQETNEFNYERYLEQLRLGEREQWTGEQLVALNDDMLGDMEWDHANLILYDLKLAGNNVEYQAKLTQAAEDIQLRHPYWREGAPGKRAGAPVEDRQAEIEAWVRDPNLRGVPIVEAARDYLDKRQFYLDGLEREFGLGSLDRSDAEHAIRARTELRGIAEAIAARVPEFKTMFDSVFANEVSTRHDGYSPERVSFYNDDIDLFEEALGISPDVLPQFTNTSLGGGTA